MIKEFDCNTLICFLDEFNGSDIFALINLKPKKIVFIYQDNTNLKGHFEDIKEFVFQKEPFTVVESKPVHKVSFEDIQLVIKQYPKDTTIVNLSGGDKLTSILAFKICVLEGYKPLFADLDNEEILDLSSNNVISLKNQVEELDVKDFIASTGGDICLESTVLYEDKKVQAIIDYIVDNYNLWNDLKMCLRNNHIINYSQENPLLIDIDLSLIRKPSQYKGFLEKAIGLDLFKVEYKDRNRIVIRFDNMDYKTLIFKAGTWLEVLVYKVIKDLKEVDDVRAGVMFQWDNDEERVRNEADVLASASGKLVYISCKDTNKYDEVALNEIEVYGEQIGGDDVIKILVTTTESYKETTRLRAKEMGIRIVTFNGDIEKLINRLTTIIMS